VAFAGSMTADPAPLTSRQLRTLAACAGRELTRGLWAVKAELAPWRARAEAIPDPGVRRQALAAMDKGRALVDGAALFWILPLRRRLPLLRLLVAFQTMLNLLDLELEREAQGAGRRPGSWMWLAREALDLTRPPPVDTIDARLRRDGGYLRALVMACRAGCATLPRYQEAHGLLIRETTRSHAFEIEHDRDVVRRARTLQVHVAQHFRDVAGTAWWELAGGASSLLTAMVVLALAADEATTPADLGRAADAYVGVASALLDSYVDRPADLASGAHNWFDYYPSDEHAAGRAAELLAQAVGEVRQLRHAERHLVIVTSMAALALSSDSARSAGRHASTAAMATGGGSMTRLLVPVLRGWRVAYGRTGD
jgi:tetraprenyl-beta-curcumene synthase